MTSVEVDKLEQQADTEGLIAAFRDSANLIDVRLAAVRAAGRVGDARAVAPLIETFTLEENQDEHEKIRRGTPYELMRAAIESLGAIGDAQATQPLIKLLREHWDGATRAAAARALGNLRAYEAIRALGEALDDSARNAESVDYELEEFSVSESAADALRKLGGAEAEEMLRRKGLPIRAGGRALP